MRLRFTPLLSIAALALAAHASAQSAHEEAPGERPPSAAQRAPTGPNGGKVQTVGAIRVETVLSPGGLRVFAYDAQGSALDVRAARGVAVLKLEGNPKRYRYDLFPETRKDGSAGSLAAAVDLSRVAGAELALDFQIVGVPGGERRPARFAVHATAPMTEAQRVAAAINEQGTCPVSGEPLGSMGEPIAVQVGDETVYVCCKSCVDTVKADPAKYAAKPPKVTVSTATEADAAAVARQKTCPVMGKPLGSMGAPVKVTGLGRDVFLCCEGCVERLKNEPAKYLAMLPPEPRPAVVKATDMDARFVAAQKLCPVMDEPLDAMGGPYKTVAEGRVVYLCCPGCAKKLHATPKAYLAKLAKQGVAPPVAR